MSKKDRRTFHLGLSMAGAVSAGAYTAGFVDFLFEALDSWEQYKKDQTEGTHKEIPHHEVIIDAIGGASAGGMVSMIIALALYSGKIDPVKKVQKKKTGNMLYDSWVFLDDDDSLYDGSGMGRTTFKKMLATDDLNGRTTTPSLLNSKPIDAIAERVFDNLPDSAGSDNFPKYVSKSLKVLLTLTSLRPLDYTVRLGELKSKFMELAPGHRVNNHDIVTRFKVDQDPIADKDGFLPFRPLGPSLDAGSNRDLLIQATKATGAFPIGLAPRYFDGGLSMDYVQEALKRRKGLNSKMDVVFDPSLEDHFRFTAVDGGAINNEPFDEVLRCLMEEHGPPDENNPKYGTLLIDPFPNFGDVDSGQRSDYDKDGILAVLGSLVPTILNQARNKRNDTYSTSLFKIMSFPKKYELGNTSKVITHPLATGGLGGFAGFLDIEFRRHDFFLGRKNAKNFLRRFFFLECDVEDVENLFHRVDPAAIEKFGRTENAKLYMPIIPDMGLLDANDDGNPTRYEVQEMPKLSPEAIKKLEAPIAARLKAILRKELNSRFSGWLWWLFKGLVVGKVTKALTKWVLTTIEGDLRDRGMLKE